jgi:hypothetical protein
LLALLKQQGDRVAELEAAEASTPADVSTPEPCEREMRGTNSNMRDCQDKMASTEAMLRAQIAGLEEERSVLEQTFERRDLEMVKLRSSLQEQMECTREQLEAKERALEQEERARCRASEMADRVQRLEAQLTMLSSQRGELETQLQAENSELAEQLAKCKRETSAYESKVDSVTKMHEDYKDQAEKLRTGLVGTAIQSKLELHISVPHVVLTYNNAPPLTVSTAIGLSKAKILKFLDSYLFPHFEPLWVCLDGVDKAPDGTNKKRYSSRMLERLTDSIKEFIEKSQIGDSAELGARPVSKDDHRDHRPTSRNSKAVEAGGNKRASTPGFKGLGSLRSSDR